MLVSDCSCSVSSTLWVYPQDNEWIILPRLCDQCMSNSPSCVCPPTCTLTVQKFSSVDGASTTQHRKSFERFVWGSRTHRDITTAQLELQDATGNTGCLGLKVARNEHGLISLADPGGSGETTLVSASDRSLQWRFTF